jgi:hypothetical protein
LTSEDAPRCTRAASRQHLTLGHHPLVFDVHPLHLVGRDA